MAIRDNEKSNEIVTRFKATKNWTTLEDQEPKISEIFDLGDLGATPNQPQNPKDLHTLNWVLLRYKPRETDSIGFVYIL